MTDFDKTAYWKKRMNDWLNSGYNQLKITLEDIKDRAEWLGADPEELKEAFIEITNGFNSVKRVIDNIGLASK